MRRITSTLGLLDGKNGSILQKIVAGFPNGVTLYDMFRPISAYVFNRHNKLSEY